MTVDPQKAAGSFEYEDQTYYFCAPGCREKFKSDPERYLRPQPSPLVGIQRPHKSHSTSGSEAKPVAMARSSDYTCPMHPEVRQAGPDSCPKCGMALEPDTIALPRQKIEYTCPMHPEIVADAPGSCPICGMALEPRTVTLSDEPNPELADMTRRFWVSAALSLP